VIYLYSYREFLELQKISREHQDKKMEQMYLNTQKKEKVEKKEVDDSEEYPFGVRFIIE
jgi:hypothetical protein